MEDEFHFLFQRPNLETIREAKVNQRLILGPKNNFLYSAMGDFKMFHLSTIAQYIVEAMDLRKWLLQKRQWGIGVLGIHMECYVSVLICVHPFFSMYMFL